jgi:predicted esterase YcpF (UPF0227 family)
MRKKLVIYIHGFLSSPLSLKAEETRQYLAEKTTIEFIAPQLSNFPDQAFAQLTALITAEQSAGTALGLIGSSLGGFFATTLAEQFNLRAVLVNPVVNPAEHRFIDRYQGEQFNPYTQERFVLTEQHRQALAAMYLPTVTRPNNLWLLAQMADEVLDYREAVEYYRDSPQIIEAGGDHRFQGFNRHLPSIIKFLGSY